ncbi:MAG: hypothetical protein WDO24_27000 [Pseudomonadota bacterium]
MRRQGELTLRVFNTIWGDVHNADEVTQWLPQIAPDRSVPRRRT